MSVKVMTWVWENSHSSGAERLVLLAIADSARDDGKDAYPAVSTIARKANMDTRTVQRAIRRLIEIGELTVTMNAGRAGSNLYQVVMTPVADCPPGTLPPPANDHRQDARGGGISSAYPRQDATQSVKNHPKEKTNAQVTSNDPGFVAFWGAFPKRIAKLGALKSYNSALKNGATADEILAGARRYATSVRGTEDKFIVHPTTWLNQGRWADEVAAPKPQVVSGGW